MSDSKTPSSLTERAEGEGSAGGEPGPARVVSAAHEPPAAERRPSRAAGPGKVWLVGAGPGEPDLITVRGRRLLEQADIVLHDELSHPALLRHVAAGAELRNVGKRGGRQSPSQEWITAQLIELGRAGKRVVRLKGGDPLLFARGAEEAEALAQAGVPFEIVPGISSPVAVAAYAGIPLTHRDLSSSVTFITGSDRAGVEWSPDAWRRLATATDTICVLMGMRRLEAICTALIEGGRAPETPAAVVQWGARPEQRVVVASLESLAERVRQQGLTNPAVIVVGEVVRLRELLRWYDRQPLFGRRILVPRPEHQASETAAAIRARGAEPCVLPAIEIVEPPDPAPLRDALRALDGYDWVLFTSANGVERAFAQLAALGRDARAFGRARIGAIGPKTAATLRGHGLRADLEASEFVGEALAREVIALGGRRVLLARALEARDVVPQTLSEAGMHVDVVAAYQTLPVSGQRRQALVDAIERRDADTVLFTSSSMVHSVVDALGERAVELLAPLVVASIGPVTSETARARGLRVDVSAERYTVDGVLSALEGFLEEGRG